jgi:hypothetical protein
MNRFFVVIILIVVGIGCLGFYLGWFRVGSDSGGDGKTHITLTVDQNKIKADENKALEKVHGVGHQETNPAAPAPTTQNGKQ